MTTPAKVAVHRALSKSKTSLDVIDAKFRLIDHEIEDMPGNLDPGIIFNRIVNDKGLPRKAVLREAAKIRKDTINSITAAKNDLDDVKSHADELFHIAEYIESGGELNCSDTTLSAAALSVHRGSRAGVIKGAHIAEQLREDATKALKIYDDGVQQLEKRLSAAQVALASQQKLLFGRYASSASIGPKSREIYKRLNSGYSRRADQLRQVHRAKYFNA